MATISKLRDAACDLFGASPMRVKALGQELAQHGLRTPGGSGRGAANMTGRDAGLLTIALALDLQTKDAAAEMSEIDSMTLQSGIWQHGDVTVWAAENHQNTSPLLAQLARTNKGPHDFPAPYTFGEFLGKWVDGVFEPELGNYLGGNAKLVLHRDGPRARFRYENKKDLVELDYSVSGYTHVVDPPWEHPLIIRGELFRRMAQMVA